MPSLLHLPRATASSTRFLLLCILVASAAALARVNSHLNHIGAASLLRGCTRNSLQRDAFETPPRDLNAPSLWLVTLRSGSSAAEVEAWAHAPSRSSTFIGRQVVVQSKHQLDARLDAVSPAIAAQPFPLSLKLTVEDAHGICTAYSSHAAPRTVHLVVRAAAAAAAAVQETLPSALRMHTRFQSSPSASAHHVSFAVSVPSQHSTLAAHWLIAHPAVMFVQLRPAFTTLNSNAAWQLQSAVPSMLPVWQHALRGEGQLISIGDTGIHPHSCFFAPGTSRLAVQSTIRSSAAAACNLQPPRNFSADSPHPKLHAYIRYTSTDFSDVPGGHGTHVSGSACGSCSGPLALFDGMAPAAKLVFIDLALEDELIVPDDLASDYFPCVYAAGARISSNSWGGSDNIYDLYASSVDAFVHAHDDLLVLVAAGNDGTNGEYTVGTPATAKNILAVGAVTSSLTTDCSNCIVNPNSVYFVVDQVNEYLISAAFGANVCSLTPSSLLLYRPPSQESDACTSFTSLTCSSMSGKAVVLRRGTCLFVEKAQRASGCSASLVIIVNLNDNKPISMDGSGQTVRIPVFSAGRQFSQVAQSITGPYINFSAFSPRVIADFSSLGPTRDGRMKPDVVAPGSPIYSSNALSSPNMCTVSGLCSSSFSQNIAAKSGTSMAAPLVAGIAALIRQYLAEGFYPGGFRGSGSSIYPSAALMRALIIGSSSSTLPLTKKQRSMAPFAQDETPSFSQGWGAPVAAAILPFANSTFPGRSFSLKIVDRWPISEQTGSLSLQFWAERDASPLTVTLAWTDPASLPSPDSAVSMLVNDIDLLLVSPQGRLYAGNSFWSIEFAPTVVKVPILDAVNNQEQVHVPAAEAGMWAVHVRAGRLSTSSQLAAVAIAGEGYYVAGAAPDRCSSWCKGTCVDANTCLCSGAQWGADCRGVVVDIPLQGIFGSYSEDVSLAVGGWRYYRFVPSLVGSTLDIYMLSTEGDPDVFVSSDDSRVPDLLSNWNKDQRCDTCGRDHPNEECDPCVDDVCRGREGCFTANRVVAQRAVIVGVHVSCCKPSSFTIKFTCQSSQAIALIVIAVFLSLLIVFMLWKRRSRIAALARSVASRWRRSTTRPRLPDFRGGPSFRQARACPAV